MKKAFVSSTYVDLQKIREDLRTALRRIGYIDLAMEYLVAEDVRPVEKCIQLARDADLYIGVFAWRYGHIPDGYSESITELEYRAAHAACKPCIILMLSDDAPWPAKWIDPDRSRIERLRSFLSEKHIVSFFSARADVAARLYEAIHVYEEKSGQVSTLDAVKIAHESATRAFLEAQSNAHASFRLFDLQRDVRLSDVYVQEVLDAVNAKGPFADLEPARKHVMGEKKRENALLSQVCSEEGMTKVFTIEGRAGAGKSTLLKMWLIKILAEPAVSEHRFIPVYVALKGFATLSEEQDRNWLVQLVLSSTPGVDESIMRALFNPDSSTVLKPRTAFVLLADGLDEVAIDARQKLLIELSRLPKCYRVAIASRPGVLSEVGYPIGSKSYELCDFNDEQISEYIVRWFASMPDVGRKLLDRIGSNSRLRSLAQIPLLLTCLSIHAELHHGFELPDSIVEHDLLKAAVEILIDGWDAWKAGRPLDVEFSAQCMQIFTFMSQYPRERAVSWAKLAKSLPEAERYPSRVTDVLSRAVKSGRVIVGNQRDGFSFSHAIFYDFFLAERLSLEG